MARRLVLWLPAAYCAVNLALFLADADWYGATFGGEDGWFENVQVAAFLAAGVLFALAARQVPRFVAVGYAVFAAVLVFAALEELSWGQRLFDLETPEALRTRNVQGELTLHNLRAVQGELGLALAVLAHVAALAWLVVPERNALAALVPPPVCTLWFLIPGLFFLALEVDEHVARVPLVEVTQQEPFETLLALGCVVFAESARRRVTPAPRR